ncbi:GntP family permease [Acidobacteria bacterium AH-259-L09]|nr:GntP family permease [Acidobacteria bacterium AH-259-L09]
MIVVVGGVLLLRLHAFLALLLGALVVSVVTPPGAIEQFALEKGMSAIAAKQLSEATIGERVAQGFGRTCGQIGIIIAMASIIGTCLLKSGSADRIVRSTLNLLGERRAPFAFLGSGFLLGIPVFFDTVFYLMIPLGKAMRMRTGKNYLLYVLTIVAGATMAHSLVPPTPGPLFVAHELGVDLGLMILGGCVVGLFTSTLGYFYAHWANRVWEIPLRESEESLRELDELSQREESQLPPIWLSVLPILLPVILIATDTGLGSISAGAPTQASGWQGGLIRLIITLGDKNIALVLAALIALATLLKMTSAQETVGAIRTGLMSAGVIILITAAGGAFGGALQQTGIGSSIQRLSTTYQVPVIPLAFVLTALIRTAQGSATVAMITAAGIFAGMADPVQLGFHPLYLALAVGCGSKPIWWMNDSGFWVVSQMSGMTERESLKTLTPFSVLMGVMGLIVIMIGAALFPLV